MFFTTIKADGYINAEWVKSLASAIKFKYRFYYIKIELNLFL